jgi:MoaA/NifB/PqqE/SkfB family radical SAM enzyme
MELGVLQFSFTGGEPFVVRQFVDILEYAALRRPCLVLTNGTEPLLKRLKQLERLQSAPNSVSFRISIDWPDRQRHEQGRGAGTFDQSLRSIGELRRMGFGVSLARQVDPNEDSAEVEGKFRALLKSAGAADDIRIVCFPDFSTPGNKVDVPRITEDCMTRFHDADSRQKFMCAFSKMVIKKNGRMRVYACTLVDDDDHYDQGSNLRSALGQRVMLRHHRCYTCFANGASCSEL